MDKITQYLTKLVNNKLQTSADLCVLSSAVASFDSFGEMVLKMQIKSGWIM